MAQITKQTVASKHRQGNGWIVSVYDPQVKTWRESSEMSYEMACIRVRNARKGWNTKEQNFKREY